MRNSEGITKEIESLLDRSTEYHNKILNDLNKKFVENLNKINEKTLSEKTGISVSAFSDIHSIEFSPQLEYPSWLRLGKLSPKSNSRLNAGVIPYYHDFSDHNNLIIRYFDNKTAYMILQNIAFRIIASLEPHLLIMHFIDPTGLGQHFSYFTELTDTIKGPKILTEPTEIERILIESKASAVNLVQEK